MIFFFLQLRSCDLSLKGQRQGQRQRPSLKARSICWKEGMNMVCSMTIFYTPFFAYVNIFPLRPLGQLISYVCKCTSVNVTVESVVTLQC